MKASYRVKSISVGHLAAFLGIAYAISSLVLLAFTLLGFNTGATETGRTIRQFGLFVPFFALIAGALTGVISGLIYNLVANMIGGLTIELEQQ